jgi:hypothetical protein
MGDTELGTKSPAADEYHRQAFSVIDGKGPFSIGYGYVNFRGQKLSASEVERFSVSRWSLIVPLMCILAFGVCWLFLTTPISFLDNIVTGLLGTNAFLVSVRFLRPGGLRLLILHRRGGARHFAFVGAYTAETMIWMWNDILVVMPDMAGRIS